MTGSYQASMLPLEKGIIDQTVFFEELIDATSKQEVYKEKIRDSKLDSSWFMPTLQQKEAVASSAIEGTQATLDGVLINQLAPNESNQDVNKVMNYYLATVTGYDLLRYHDFSHEFFFTMHSALMRGNVEKPDIVGAYRVSQNYIGKKDKSHAITFIPPCPKMYPVGWITLLPISTRQMTISGHLSAQPSSMRNLSLSIPLWTATGVSAEC